MIVGVMSDTHDNTKFLPGALKEFKRAGVEMVIHLGDFIAPFTLEDIASRVDVRLLGVLGNNDGEKLGLASVCARYGCELRDSITEIEIGGVKILAFHGFGAPELTERLAWSLAYSGSWDVVLYGHTHKPLLSYVRRVLVLNPGTAGGVLNTPSIAILDTERMKPELVKLA